MTLFVDEDKIQVMETYFDIPTLHRRLKEFHTVTGLRMTVFDTEFNEIVGYPSERARFCEEMRRDPEADAACRRCDRAACDRVRAARGPYVYECHLGLTEIISPIVVGGVTAGYIFIAHIMRSESRDERIAGIIDRCGKYTAARRLDLTGLLDELPSADEEYLIAAAHLLEAVAAQICMERMAVPREARLEAKIAAYVDERLGEELSVKELTRAFGMGKTALEKLSRAAFGTGIAAYVKKKRLERAAELLASEEARSVTEVAEKCGFGDYCYFIAEFRRAYGITPLRYRKEKTR